MAKDKEPTITITLTKAELWEAINLISASFIPGPGNELAERVSKKLSDAHRRLK